MKDQAVGREVDVLEGAEPVEGAKVDFVFEEEKPLVLSFGPYSDCYLGRLGYCRVQLGEFE